jgi:hypothetical protein
MQRSGSGTFERLSRYFRGGTERNHTNRQPGQEMTRLKFQRGIPKYKPRTIALHHPVWPVYKYINHFHIQPRLDGDAIHIHEHVYALPRAVDVPVIHAVQKKQHLRFQVRISILRPIILTGSRFHFSFRLLCGLSMFLITFSVLNTFVTFITLKL